MKGPFWYTQLEVSVWHLDRTVTMCPGFEIHLRGSLDGPSPNCVCEYSHKQIVFLMREDLSVGLQSLNLLWVSLFLKAPVSCPISSRTL